MRTGDRTSPTALCTTSITAADWATFRGTSTACRQGRRSEQGFHLRMGGSATRGRLFHMYTPSRAAVVCAHLPHIFKAAAGTSGLVGQEEHKPPAGKPTDQQLCVSRQN